MSGINSKAVSSPNTPKKKESFFSGLFSLMTWQCILSALLFGIIYILKNTNFAFSPIACDFIKGIVYFDMSAISIKNIIAELFM